MKILISLIISFLAIVSVGANEQMTYTFKAHNFRLSLPNHWELKKKETARKQKPIILAHSKEDRIHLEIYTSQYKKEELQDGFIKSLKTLQLWAENYISLDQEAEFPLYHLNGYWAKTTGFKQKKKIYGYLVYATDGVNLFTIHTYTNASFFPKNFHAMKEVLKGFSLNRNYKNECCNECGQLSTNLGKDSSCISFTETDECMVYFQNQPMSILQCK